MLRICAGGLLAREPCGRSVRPWEKWIWKGIWPYLDPMETGKASGLAWTQGTVCVCAQHPCSGMCQGEVRAAWRALFLPDSEEPASMLGSDTVIPFLNADIRTPFFSADVLKKCALIALHLIAEEGRGGEDGCHAPGLGRMENELP